MKWAYFCRPHPGGTWSVFVELRAALAAEGVELFWIGRGEAARAALADPAAPEAVRAGVAVGDDARDDAEQARLLIEALEAAGADGVFINVLADRTETNLARYLPSRILRVMVVHNITIGTYEAAAAIRDHVHAVIGVSRRIREDLIAEYDFEPALTFATPNAVRVGTALRRPRPIGTKELRVVFLGRVEDAAKGVLLIPPILAAVGAPLALTVVGDGPDCGALRAKIAETGLPADFKGMLPPEAVRAVLAEQDVALLPSRYEGHPMALMEAMAAGCVPVVSRIRGVTDDIVSPGANGFLFEMGRVAEAARILRRLAVEPWRLDPLSMAAAACIRERHRPRVMAAGYAKAIRIARSVATPDPLPLSRWHFPPGLRDGWRTRVPAPLKTFLRTARERFSV